MTENTTEIPTAYVVCVQSAVGDMETDWFWLEPGYEAEVESNSARELIISKYAPGETDEEEFVAIYGTDMWVRAWVAEYDPDAPEEDEEPVE